MISGRDLPDWYKREMGIGEEKGFCEFWKVVRPKVKDDWADWQEKCASLVKKYSDSYKV